MNGILQIDASYKYFNPLGKQKRSGQYLRYKDAL